MGYLNFSKLDNKTQSNWLTTPMLVPITIIPDDETEEQLSSRHDKFLSLPKEIKNKLASSETSQKIQAIGQKYGFELLRLANITRLIREYYFGEVKFEDFPKEIEKRMGVSLFTAQEIARYIKKEIIDWDPWKEYLEKLPKASAREILTKFPKVAEQEITDGYLEFKDKPEEIFDPTIQNWLRDYVLHLGQERHSNIQRMDYLFRAENTKNLTSTEREKLGIILKSFDENIPLPIDPENNEVVFDVSEKPATPEKAFPSGGVITERPVFKDQETPFKNQSFPSQSNIRAPQGQTLSGSSRDRFIQPQKPAAENFIKPYPQTINKPSTSPQPAQKNIPHSQLPVTNYHEEIQFSNPFPAPGTHEPKITETEMAGETPVKFKGFSEGVATAAPPASLREQARLRSVAGGQKPYAPSHPKNVIYPHYGPQREEKPEPKIDGNIVDLSGDK